MDMRQKVHKSDAATGKKPDYPLLTGAETELIKEKTDPKAKAAAVTPARGKKLKLAHLSASLR